jgi:S-DNA-T family DNA segregation ATPase FtsK/SpoIIIE
MASKEEQFYNFIKPYIETLKERGYKKAQEIYIMPETVDYEKMKEKYTGLTSVPIGIYKDSLNCALYDFTRRIGTIISSNEFDNLSKFIRNLVDCLANGSGFMPYFIDANNFYESFEYEKPYTNDNFNEFVDNLMKGNEKIQEILAQNNMNYKMLKNIPNTLIVIIGFEKFYKKLDDEHKKTLQKIFADNKEEPKFNFIFIDIPSSFKKYEYEDWYKQTVDATNGIWVGPGLGQQFVLKASNQLTSFSAISLEYACVLKNGTATITKLINKIK